MFKYAKKNGYTSISITQFIGDLDISKKSFRKHVLTDEESVYTNSEVDRIVNYIFNNEITLMTLGVILAFQTGLRAGELSTIKWSDINGSILNVSRTEIRYKDKVTREYVYTVRESTKGRDGCRKVILTDDALKTIKMIKKLHPFGDYLFVHENGERIKGRAFSLKLERICCRIGIRPRSLHKARKTYCTKLLNAGVDEKLIEMQVGHTDIKTTKNYYYYNNRDLEEAKSILASAIQ